MTRMIHSFRSKLLLIYFFTITISAVMLTCILSEYFTNLILEQNTALTRNTLNAVSQNIDTYLDDLDRISILPYMDNGLLEAFHLYSNDKYQSVDNYSLCEAKRKISTSFQLSLDTNRNEVDSILIIYPDGKADYFNRYSEVSVKSDYQFVTQKWYQSILAADGSAAFIDLHAEDYLEIQSQNDVFSIGRLIKDPDTQKSLVAIVSNINNNALNSILNVDNFGTSSYILIQDNKGNLVYSPQKMTAELKETILQCKSSTITIDHIEYVKLDKPIGNTDWDINVLVPYYQIENNITITKITISILILFQIIFAFSLFCIWSHSITNRFSEIRNVMCVAKNGDLTVRYGGKKNDEISALGNDLNDMIIQISGLMEKERDALTKMKSAEYQALQAQINPHFIYNILNGLIGLNRLGKRDVLEEAILSLSRMMRYILEHQEYATIGEEVEFVNQYCKLQKLRFENRFALKIAMDDFVKDFKIPKLLLQPLVENAILHGLESLDHPGVLDIQAKTVTVSRENFIRISVIDNGIGFDTGKAADTNCLGIKNVRERLNLSFHDAVLELTSRIGEGTQATILINTDAGFSLPGYKP